MSTKEQIVREWDGGIRGEVACPTCGRIQTVRITEVDLYQIASDFSLPRGSENIAARILLEQQAGDNCKLCTILRRKPTPEIRAARLRSLERRLQRRRCN